MSTTSLFVDLPNFYSRLLSSGIEDQRTLRDYFLHWFDFDRLANKLTRQYSNVWVFYSGRRFGPSSNRVQDSFLDDFIDRTNSLKGVTARDVNIPGQQREPASYVCEQCGHTGLAQWESEKGIDASLTVQLFDTLDSWDEAYLLSGDADFVPTVESLRRRGKIVIGAGFSGVSSALVRECYEYLNLSELFLRDDIAAYQIFKDDGIVQRWMLGKIDALSKADYSSDPVELSFEWQRIDSDIMGSDSNLLTIDDVVSIGPKYRVFLITRGPIDLTSRCAIVSDFHHKFPQNVEDSDISDGHISLLISPLAWEGVRRRLKLITSKYSEAVEYEARLSGQGFTLRYTFDSSSKNFVVTPKSICT